MVGVIKMEKASFTGWTFWMGGTGGGIAVSVADVEGKEMSTVGSSVVVSNFCCSSCKDRDKAIAS